MTNSLQLELLSGLLVIFGSVFPDFDILFGLYLKKNHRLFFTHHPSFWILTTLISAFFDSQMYWFCIAGLLHTLVDVIDWDIYLFQPISNRKYSILSLNSAKVHHTSSLIEFLTNYYHHYKVVLVEIVLALLCILSFFLY